jgi:hypothetical protein
VSCIDCR